MRLVGSRRVSIRALVLVLALGACGDAPTDDARGYTKAPLEDPGLTIESESRTRMDALGDPILRPTARDSMRQAEGSPSTEQAEDSASTEQAEEDAS